MSIINTLKDSVRKMLTLDKVSFVPHDGFSLASEDSSDAQLQISYKDSLYISTGLLRIKDAVSSIDFKLYKIRSSKGEAEELVSHELLDLLYKPNPLQTKSEFWRIFVVNFKLSGENFIRLIKNEQGKILYMVNVSPSDVVVELKDDMSLVYKVTASNGVQNIVPQDEMVHIKDPDIINQLRGYSNLRPLLERVKAEINAVDYQAGVFGKNGNPDGLLFLKGSGHTQEDITTAKRSFYNSFKGSNDKNKVAVIGGDATYQPLNGTNTVLNYKEAQNQVRDDIMTALGVPKSLITTDDVNRANAEAGLQQFMQFTIAPMFKLILETLNERLVIPFYGEDLYLDTDKLVTEDKEMLLKESQAGVNQWLTINEIRTRFGYEPIDGGDEIKDTSSFFQGFNQQNNLNPSIFKSRSKLYARLKMFEEYKEASKKKAYKKTLSSPEFRVKFASAVNSVRVQSEMKMGKETKKYFKEQLARIEKKLEEVGDSFTTANDFFDVDKENKEAMLYVLPVYNEMAVKAGNVALTPLTMLTGKANNFTMTSSLLKKLEARAKLFSSSINDTTYQIISTAVSENIEMGVSGIKKVLREAFDDMTSVRAERIARTESCFMTSLGTDMAYQENELVEAKEWISSGDGKVREEHVENDGWVVNKYEAFPNGEQFPGEQTINCRCAIAPIVR